MHDITAKRRGGRALNVTAEAKDKNQLTAGVKITGRFPRLLLP